MQKTQLAPCPFDVYLQLVVIRFRSACLFSSFCAPRQALGCTNRGEGKPNDLLHLTGAAIATTLVGLATTPVVLLRYQYHVADSLSLPLCLFGHRVLERQSRER